MVICAIFKNEARYLKEWIEFHLKQGVEKFYLYQNNSADKWQFILDYPEVDVTGWPMRNPSQLAAYQHCIDRLKGQKEWGAFIDVDEFLFSPLCPTLDEAMRDLPPHWGAVGVNWVCYGSGGKMEWEDAPVTERFTKRTRLGDPMNLHIKSIVRMDQEVKAGTNPHFFEVERGTFDELGRKLTGAYTETHTSCLLRINHYISKSYAEWVERNRWGKPDRAELEAQPWTWDEPNIEDPCLKS